MTPPLRRVLFAAVALSLLAAPASEAAQRRIRPERGATSVKLQIGPNARTYHVASRQSPVTYKIAGPATVRVASRLLFAGSPEPASYAIRVEVDGVLVRTIQEEAGVSTRAKDPGGKPVGTLENDLVLIPSGSHDVRLVPEDAASRVAVRVFRGSRGTKKAAWVTFAPVSYERAVRFHSKESETVYYRFTAEKPVTFHMYGPTPVRLETRLDFGLERTTSQTYAIKVFVDGALLQTYSLKSKASHTTSYPELPEIVPGAARDASFSLNKGKHLVKVVLDATTARGAALRILIPEKAVKNGG
jgi:hypothetical protein